MTVGQSAGILKPPSRFEMVVLEALVAACINTVMSSLVAWILFHSLSNVPVWGIGGVMFSTLPTSIFPAVAMTIAGTIAMRKRFAKALFHNQLPLAPGWITLLPANLVARAAVLAVCTALAVIGATFLGVSLAHVPTVSFFTLMAIQVVQAILMGVVLGPIIVLRALAEPRKARSDG